MSKLELQLTFGTYRATLSFDKQPQSGIKASSDSIVSLAETASREKK